MNIGVVLILMIFAHIVDDYYLQGILAKLKQRDWWYSKEANVPEQNEIDKCKERVGFRNIKLMYQYDYIVALIMYAAGWSIMILLPLLFYSNWNPHWVYYLLLGVNLIVHSIVDNLKANKKKINLITDQVIHIIQVCITFAIYMGCVL